VLPVRLLPLAYGHALQERLLRVQQERLLPLAYGHALQEPVH
jgi:hypothetical protein